MNWATTRAWRATTHPGVVARFIGLKGYFQVKTRVHLYISGRVQGVFFRDSAQQTAQSCGVTGFVKNLRDSRVELIAEGEDEAIKKLIQWCHSGPPAANVESVEMHHEPYSGEFPDFEVRR